MVGLSRLSGVGLLLVLALLPLALDGKSPPQALHKPPPALSAPSRLMGALRPDSKQSRASWDRMVHPEPHVGGGGSGDSRRMKGLDKKSTPDGCFGHKLDSIGSHSGLGCPGAGPRPKPTPGAGR